MNAISNKIAPHTHLHLDTVTPAPLTWTVAPTTDTGGLLILDEDLQT